MKQTDESGQPMESRHFDILRRIVGDSIARDDLPAVERAYQDFRSGMDQLRRTFENLKTATKGASDA